MIIRALIFIFICIISYNIKAQEDILNRTITVNYENTPIKYILDDLSVYYGLDFSFSESKISLDQTINIQYQNISLRELFEILFHEKGMDYRIVKNQIVIFPMKNSLHKQKYSVYGIVKDTLNGETLIGVTILIEELKTGTITNQYGFYSITLPEGIYNISFTYIGYSSYIHKIELIDNTKLNINLHEINYNLNEVVIKADKENKNITSNEMGVSRMEIQMLNKIPSLLGEGDIIRNLRFLPGIYGDEISTNNVYVRGGQSSQTFFLMDDAPLLNVSHIGGIFSIFNPDAVKSVDVYKGPIPSKFGGALSSIIDVRMKDGNNQKYTGSLALGTISSRISLEGPIIKDKMSFIVSGRRSYLDKIINLIDNETLNTYFYDFNAKVNYKVNENNRIFFASYFGEDISKSDFLSMIEKSNFLTSFRWNHIFSQRLFINTTLIASKNSFKNHNVDYTLKLGSDNYIYQVKSDFWFYRNPKHKMDFGYSCIYQIYSPYHASYSMGNKYFIRNEPFNERSLVNSTYFENNFSFNENLSLNINTRFSLFQSLGPKRIFRYMNNDVYNDIEDTLYYKKNQLIKSYYGFEPAIGFRYIFLPQLSVKAGYNRTTQFVHNIGDNDIYISLDRWIPSSEYIEPQISDNFVIGYFQNFLDNKIEISLELYYRFLNKQINLDYKSDNLLTENPETIVTSGFNKIYGTDLFVLIKSGKFDYLLSYTYLDVKCKTGGINLNRYYQPNYSRKHDLSVVTTYNLSNRISISLNWVCTSGLAYNKPLGKYELDNLNIPYFNQDKLNISYFPAYHRLDFSFDLYGKQSVSKKWKGHWNLSLYNVYWRKNPIGIYYEKVNIIENNTSKNYLKPKILYFFQFAPSITYSLSFN